MPPPSVRDVTQKAPERSVCAQCVLIPVTTLSIGTPSALSLGHLRCISVLPRSHISSAGCCTSGSQGSAAIYARCLWLPFCKLTVRPLPYMNECADLSMGASQHHIMHGNASCMEMHGALHPLQPCLPGDIKGQPILSFVLCCFCFPNQVTSRKVLAEFSPTHRAESSRTPTVYTLWTSSSWCLSLAHH